MTIRPKISKFQNGGNVPQWFLNLYKQHALTGWNNTLNKDYSNQNLNINGHYNAGDLETVYNKNNIYTGTPDVVRQDIQSFYDSDGSNMTPEEFVKYYNENAEKIRSHWASDRTYNQSTAGDHNRLYRRMFKNRSKTSNEPGSAYNIGYQEGVTRGGYDIQDIEGSSTWLRRMDRYENEFDPNNPDSNRIHEITLSNGSKAKVYKKANGDIGLLEVSEGNLQQNGFDNPSDNGEQTGGRIPVGLGDFDDTKKKFLNNPQKIIPGLLTNGRLINTLLTNKKVYENAKKAIFPVLQQSYHTHRQVAGDEATKQAYYTRAAQGQTKAARPFTAHADRQMAYQMEAKRVGDQLRAEGDLADNKEIRRTSDESMQHAWENQARDTQVANENTMAIAKAKAAKYNLETQKASAMGTSWDNYLKELQYNVAKRNQEEYAYKNQLDQYDFVLGKDSDEDIVKAQAEYDKANAAYTENETSANYAALTKAAKNLKLANIRYRQKWDQQHPPYTGTYFYGRKGGKFDHDAELLYKVSRDAVKHFREMSKQSDDSRIKTLPKSIKLKNHPKGSTRRMQYGGQAPFMVYTPLALGGGDGTQAASASTKSSSKKQDTPYDVVKDLFKDIVGKGLPADVNQVYKSMSSLLRSLQVSGEEIDSDDLASLYLRQMKAINELQFSQNLFNKATENVNKNDGLNEFAVSQDGRLVVQDQESGKTTLMSVEDYKQNAGKYAALTNDQVLHMRAYGKPFDNEILQIVNNGVGIRKVAEYIRNNVGNLGTTEFEQDGYTKKQAQSLSTGIEYLRQIAQQGDSRAMSAITSYAQAPEGYYKETLSLSNQQKQAAEALKYVYNMLPNNMRTILSLHGDPVTLIASYIGGKISDKFEYQSTALTGKAAKDANGNSGADGEKMDPAMAFFMGMGERNTFIIQDKTKDGLKVDTISMPLLDKSGNGMSNATLQQLKGGHYSGQLNIKHATMGGVRISPNGVNNVLLTGGNIYQTELPIDEQALANGVIRPDLSFLKNKEKADEQVRAQGITDRSNLTQKEIQIINKIYKDNNLPIIYTTDGSGKPVLTARYRRFALLDGYATKDAFEGEDLSFNDGVEEVDSDKEQDQFEAMMREVTNNEKYKLERHWFSSDLYKGVVYIPMVESTLSALAGTSYKGKQSEYNEMERLQQQSDFSRNIGYNPAGSFTK